MERGSLAGDLGRVVLVDDRGLVLSEKRSVVVDVGEERIWISSDAGGVWSFGGQALGVVNEVVESVELWIVAWKLSRAVVVVAEWSEQ